MRILTVAALVLCASPVFAQAEYAVKALTANPGVIGEFCSMTQWPDVYIVLGGPPDTWRCEGSVWVAKPPVGEVTGTAAFVRQTNPVINTGDIQLTGTLRAGVTEGVMRWDAGLDQTEITDGTSSVRFWPGAHGGGASPPGSDTENPLNDFLVFCAYPRFTYNKTTGVQDTQGIARISNATGQQWDQEITTIGIYDVALTDPPYPGVSSVGGVEYTRTDDITQTFLISAPGGYNATTGGVQAGGISYQPQSSITASTTQSQGQQQLTSSIADVTIVANDNDVVTLVTSGQYGFAYVKNSDAAETLQVYPQSGDDLGKGTDVSTTVAPGWVLECWALAPGWWCTQWAATGDAPTGGGGGSASGAPNYTQSFTSETSVTLTHALGTKNVLVACYDSTDLAIGPDGIDINPTDPWAVVVTFEEAETGRCVVNGLMNSGRYTASFSGQTTVTVTGATHGIGTNMLAVTCYDDADPRNTVGPDNVTVDDGTFDVVVTFFESETGKCVLQ